MRSRNWLFVCAAIASQVLLAGQAVAQSSGVDVARLQAIMERQAQLQAIAENKVGFVSGIVSQWAGYAASVGYDDTWGEELTRALMKLAPEKILEASKAATYQEVVNIVSGRKAGAAALTAVGAVAVSATDEIGPAALGSGSTDLVYFPVTPCRIIDTRVAGGAFAANQTRSFLVNGTLTAQGGNPSGCGLPTDPAAVALTLTVTGGAGFGWLTAWPYLDPMPTASVLNWSGSETHANTTIVPQCQLCGPDIYINAANSAVHVIADVVGYFWSPTATALDVTTVTDSVSVAAGASATVQAICPAGRTMTGGGCNLGSFSSPLYFISSNPVPNTNDEWNCAVQNRGAVATTLTVYVRCAAVPGR